MRIFSKQAYKALARETNKTYNTLGYIPRHHIHFVREILQHPINFQAKFAFWQNIDPEISKIYNFSDSMSPQELEFSGVILDIMRDFFDCFNKHTYNFKYEDAINRKKEEKNDN